MSKCQQARLIRAWTVIAACLGLAMVGAIDSAAAQTCTCAVSPTPTFQPPPLPRPLPRTTRTVTPPPPKEKPEDIREQDALQLEAEEHARHGRWDDAAKNWLEIFKKAADPSRREAARRHYQDAIAKALPDPKEDRARLLAAKTERQAGRWSAAAEKYLDALTKATDDNSRDEAMKGYTEAAQIVISPWWRMGRYVPPVWWAHEHRAGSAGLLVVVLVVLVSPLFITGAPITDRIFGGLPELIRPKFSGRATVLATVMLTDGAPAPLFAAQLPYCALEVRRRWQRVGVSFLSGSTTLLSVPGVVADQVATEIPKIKGIDIGAWAKWLLLVAKYFSWRVESQVGFSPDTANTPSEGRMRAYATLRWAWFTYGSYAVAPRAAHDKDFERASYAIAARVLGAAQPKRERR